MITDTLPTEELTTREAERMEAGVRVGSLTMSPTIGTLAGAMLHAQSTVAPVVKDKKADLGAAGKYRYATLHTLLESVIAAFSAQKIAVIQGADLVVDGVRVTTLLAHECGEWIASSLTMSFGDARPQTIGSAITYARRYSLQALCGVAAEDDDDGAAAQASAGSGRRPADTLAAKIASQGAAKVAKPTPPRRPAESDELKALSVDLRNVANLVAASESGEVPHWRDLVERASGIRPWPEHPTEAQIFKARSGLDNLRRLLAGDEVTP